MRTNRRCLLPRRLPLCPYTGPWAFRSADLEPYYNAHWFWQPAPNNDIALLLPASQFHTYPVILNLTHRSQGFCWYCCQCLLPCWCVTLVPCLMPTHMQCRCCRFFCTFRNLPAARCCRARPCPVLPLGYATAVGLAAVYRAGAATARRNSATAVIRLRGTWFGFLPPAACTF